MIIRTTTMKNYYQLVLTHVEIRRKDVMSLLFQNNLKIKEVGLFLFAKNITLSNEFYSTYITLTL